MTGRTGVMRAGRGAGGRPRARRAGPPPPSAGVGRRGLGQRRAESVPPTPNGRTRRHRPMGGRDVGATAAVGALAGWGTAAAAMMLVCFQ